ncbi:serine/threonine-protein kinase [Frankia sp. Cppng1_Ct_nod]|uniref:serine/threonine-protein kinase n=1 Tax=Frankia sp. Cppng1_Ct_nod TaxID=2897162 RepID=UPI0010419E41|nr:serine/threonine-protein kinase [Frankia sp. Cppng1_Ct_nod]
MAVDQARIATALPDYDVGAELGRGGFGAVLAGRHKLIHRDVAIKVLLEDASGVEDIRERFLAEARVLAGLDHPHVVRIYDYVERDGLCLLVMEKLTGGSLRRRFAQGLSQPAACAIGLSAATALAAAHAQGVLHRDVKPDNLLFTDAGLPKMTDFGIAKILETTATTTTGLIGTPRYMAPEQIAGDRLSPATDLYALGLVIYELLAGRPPFEKNLTVPAMLYHHLNVAPAPLVEAPDPVAEVIGRVLEKNPPSRHPSAEAFAVDLAVAAAGAFGPSWLTASEVPTTLPDAIIAAARGGASAPTRSLTKPREFPQTSGSPWWPTPGTTGSGTTGSGTTGSGTTVAGAVAAGAVAAGAVAAGGRTDTTARVPVSLAAPPPAGPEYSIPHGTGGHPTHPAPERRRPRSSVRGLLGSGVRRLLGGRRNRIMAAVLAVVLVAAGIGLAFTLSGSGPKPGRAAYSGRTLDAGLSQVSGLAIGADGTIVVSDSTLGRVTTIDSAGHVNWLAGTRKPSSSTAASTIPVPTATTAAQKAALNQPGAVAVDRNGTVYVAAGYDGQIFKITQDGAIALVAGAGPKQEGFTGNRGTATFAELPSLTGVAIDKNGDVLIADGTRLLRVTPTDGMIDTIAGTSGTGGAGTSGDGGPATAARLAKPTGIAVARNGAIYILDRTARTVRKIAPNGTISRVAGKAPATGTTSSTPSPMLPTASASPPAIGSVGDGSPATDVALDDPTGIALAPNGDLYIADYGSSVIRVVKASNGRITTFAGARSATDPGDGGDAREARVYAPTGVAVDGTGAVYVTQYGGVVRRIGSDGIIMTVLKSG